MLADIDEETVDFVANYDGKEREPTVLPTRLPNLLVNGSSGIAVGMATNIPPHNLSEIVTACLALLGNPEITVDELIEHVPAPDFPTAGIIYGTEGVREGYRTGRGRVVIRARTHIEDLEKGSRQAIIVDELPYQVNKAAPTPAEAKAALMAKRWRSALVEDMLKRAAAEAARPEGLAPEFGWQESASPRGYNLSDAQAQAILELRLQRLTGLEQGKITSEYKDVMAQIVDLLDILAKPSRVTTIVGTELSSIRDQFGDKRRSEIVAQGVDLSIEDLIAPQDMVVTLSHGGYMKAQPVAEYRAQRRGGRGKQATGTKEDDFIDRLFIANTHDNILCFSNRGRVYWLKVYNVPQGGRIARGKPIVNLVPLLEHEKITAILPVKEFVDDHFVFMATAKGTVKKTPLSEFSRPRPSGIIAIDLDDGDFLIGAALTDGKHDVMLFSSGGKAVRFEEGDVRPMGRVAHGVRGMLLDKGQRVISMLVAEDGEQSVLTATENGYGKRTPIVEHTRHGRGSKGMIAIQQTKRNGRVVAASLVRSGDEVMLISTGGVLIRTKVSSIREMS